jgi:hypothetical protein
MPISPIARIQELLPSGNAWEVVRRPLRHTDEALTGTTRVWFRKLPGGRRPHRLCIEFPRIANRIAWHWQDPETLQELLDDLLNDRRGGRRGFPKAIALELRRLRDFSQRQQPDEGGGGYLASLRAIWAKH